MAHPYRDDRFQKRGPLTRGEKLRLGLRGLLKGAPLLEQHRFGLDPRNGLPPEERLRHARKVAASEASSNLFLMIKREGDSIIKALLVESFCWAVRGELEILRRQVGDSASGMAAISALRRLERHRAASADMARELAAGGHMELEEARRLMGMVEG
jgi:hypothetical protein